jgi:hypothetical protein
MSNVLVFFGCKGVITENPCRTLIEIRELKGIRKKKLKKKRIIFDFGGERERMGENVENMKWR